MGSHWPEQEVFEAGRRSLARKKQVPSKKLLKYLTEFRQDDGPQGFAVQREKLLDAVRKKFPEHGYRQTIRGFDAEIQKFWELLLAMHYVTHEIKLTGNMGNDKVELFPGLSTAKKIPFAELKIVGEELRQAIAPQAEQPPAENTIQPEEEFKYRLTYNPSERVLRLNDIPIAKPQYGSENDQFLRFFVAENHTGEHAVTELLKYMGKSKLTKRPTQILYDLKITGNIKSNFFPNASIRSIEFRNPITELYAKENDLPEIDLAELSQISQK